VGAGGGVLSGGGVLGVSSVALCARAVAEASWMESALSWRIGLNGSFFGRWLGVLALSAIVRLIFR